VLVKGFFASTPTAQEVRTLVSEGVIDSMSVGFLKGQRERRNGKTVITKAEMLEATFTAIPANTNATVLAVKNLEPLDDEDLELRARAIRLSAFAASF